MWVLFEVLKPQIAWNYIQYLSRQSTTIGVWFFRNISLSEISAPCIIITCLKFPDHDGAWCILGGLTKPIHWHSWFACMGVVHCCNIWRTKKKSVLKLSCLVISKRKNIQVSFNIISRKVHQITLKTKPGCLHSFDALYFCFMYLGKRN